jgi:hypothetical protein
MFLDQKKEKKKKKLWKCKHFFLNNIICAEATKVRWCYIGNEATSEVMHTYDYFLNIWE